MLSQIRTSSAIVHLTQLLGGGRMRKRWGDEGGGVEVAVARKGVQRGTGHESIGRTGVIEKWGELNG